MTSDGYSQTVELVERDVVHGARFAIAQDDGSADKLGMSLINSVLMVDARAFALGMKLVQLCA